MGSKRGAVYGDLTGQKFGKLTAIRFLRLDRYKSGVPRIIWEFRCDCGELVEFNAVHVMARARKGQSVTCGKLKCRPSLAKNLVGKRFSRLLVIERVFIEGDGYVRWMCRCDCGKEIVTSAANLAKGDRRSCGCLAKEMRDEKPRLPPGEAGFREIASRYKSVAKRRGISFDLTDEQLRVLFEGRCHYCGLPPSSEHFTLSRGVCAETRKRGVYVSNGIDRVDNKLGYTADNVVTCCACCNFMKGPWSEKAFLTKVALIALRLDLLGFDMDDIEIDPVYRPNPRKYELLDGELRERIRTETGQA